MLFAQYLSKTHTVQSVKNYVAGVHTLHKYLGLPFPDLSEFFPRLFFKGLSRLHLHIPHQALPITPSILLEIHSILDLCIPLHLVFWSACLVAFFSFLRQSNMLAPSSPKFDPTKQLARGSIHISAHGLLLTLVWSKTIQSGGRSLQIPLSAIPGSPLCPLAAYRSMISRFPATPGDPAFLLPSPTGFRPLTKPVFVYILRACLKARGYPHKSYSGHSFRRGGASTAFRAGVRGELVKLQGDWKSDAYLRYLHTPLEDRWGVSRSMAHLICPAHS